jgi:hypothetical protein
VSAEVADAVVRAASELLAGAAAKGSGVKGSAPKAAKPPVKAKALAVKAPAAKAPAAKGSAAKKGSAPKAAKPPVKAKAPVAKAPVAKAPAAKISGAKASGAKAPGGPAAKRPASKSAVAGKAAPKRPVAGKAAPAVPETVRRGPGRPSKAELAGQQVVHPPQSASRIPEAIRDFKPRIDTKKGDEPPAHIARRFFEEQRKWGYDVSIGGEVVGQLLFDHDGVWSLGPTDGRLVERGIRMTVHANPVSAFVRVTHAWRRAITGQSDAPVGIPAAKTEAA